MRLGKNGRYIAAAALFGAFWLYVGSYALNQARHHDFLCIYTGAWMVAHGRAAVLYDPAAQLAFQRDVIHSTSGLMPYIRPPFYALALAPLGLLPYDMAFVVWVSGQILLLVGCWVWASRRFGPRAALIGSIFMPTALGIAHGQDCVFPLALLIVSYTLAEREKPAASGLVLGAMLVKFHLILLWPLGLALRHRWKMMGGFVAAAALLGAVSLSMVGISGLHSYLTLLQNPTLENLSPSPEFMISVPGLLANLGLSSMAVKVAATGLVIALWAWSIRRVSLAQMYTISTVACLLPPGHVYGYDASLLLLGIWLTLYLPSGRSARIGALLVATPLAFCFGQAGKPWGAIASLSLLAFLALLTIDAAAGDKQESTAPTSLPMAPPPPAHSHRGSAY
jgi:hypothetical protein